MEVKCKRCGTDEQDEREPLHGFAQIRCRCGVRRAPRVKAVDLPPESPRARAGNGFSKDGIFYGTCKSPRCNYSEFESIRPRQTCGATLCRTWANTRPENLTARVCRCGTSYTTSELHPNEYCGPTCLAAAKQRRDAAGRFARRLLRDMLR
ncbi:hypothetical protein UFOVP1558_23 [uncultured Caudovirales phage]|uniref:Uncharacterized protein n=1 Tax=uncultured Caudovirales phage TaxID=2100421 RepID=A0A6J7XIN3_9CAUD|nr:hypothetical protein UFOVP1558_23 [uncultured Caudovirales phage]